MDAKSAILARARDAISRSQTRPVGPIPRNYIRSGENPPGSKPVVDEMIEKLEDYSAEVIVAPKDAAILDAIDELLGEARTVVVPDGLPEAYTDAAVGAREPVVDARQMGEDPSEYAGLLRNFPHGGFLRGLGSFQMALGKAPFEAASPVAACNDGDVSPSVLDRQDHAARACLVHHGIRMVDGGNGPGRALAPVPSRRRRPRC